VLGNSHLGFPHLLFARHMWAPMGWYPNLMSLLAVFWIFWSKIKMTQTDAPTIRMTCHPILTHWCPRLCHRHHFYAECPSWTNHPILSWLGTGTKYALLHTWWLSCIPGGIKMVKETMLYADPWYCARGTVYKLICIIWLAMDSLGDIWKHNLFRV